jgi:hypothetical protein
LTQTPIDLSAYHGCHALASNGGTAAGSFGAITWRIGNLYLRANSMSRSSCAGTPMTAPSP